MEVSISKEAFVFLSSCLTGGIVVFVYDLFRMIRRASAGAFVMIHIQDGLFWLIAFGIIFFSVLHINNGTLRMYELVGVLLGGFLYKLMLSKLITDILYWLLTFFSKFFKIFLKILLTPIRFAYNIIYGCLYVLLKPLKQLIRRGFQQVCEGSRRTLRFAKKK